MLFCKKLKPSTKPTLGSEDSQGIPHRLMFAIENSSMDVPTNHIENSNSGAQPNKRRRKKSKVWDHFTIVTVNADIRACCNQCNKLFAYISGSKLAGTSHLKRHIFLGICPVSQCNQEKNQLGIYKPDTKSDVSGNGTVQQKKRLRATSGPARRVSLTLDLWTSDQRVSYGLLTGHFIGCDWKLYRRIFNVVMLPSPDSETAFDQAVAASLNDWSSESKLFTVTLDQSHANENAKRNLRGLLSIKNSRILNGQLLINSCYACTLTRIAQDALGFIRETVEKVRDSVKYVKTSEAREERFMKLKQQLQLELMHAASSPDLFVSSLTKPLHEKFTRYWEDCNLVLAVAVVMDPRLKMKLVEFSFPRIYGEDADNWIKIIDEDVHELYLEYIVQCLPPPTFIEEGNEAVVKIEIPQDDGLLPNDKISLELELAHSPEMHGDIAMN
ncbi:unnamed protein product [Fraxinus pennsylvanica]|uniref:BED-type domain-containing protein n=1 Tax=Fraxinus pennsylvanica TaxID=56036 RepID=A0AAD2DXS4_9LAMI|nr:unnamed protein product [Fraxinus pennsylvanica]